MAPIALGGDHGGYGLKEEIKRYLKDLGYQYKDYGTQNGESCDYADFALPVAEAVAKKECEKGILFCGTGIGMSLVANKIPGIRAALCHSIYTAKMAREHNDANILTLGGRIITKKLAQQIVYTFLTTKFKKGRHLRRIEKITKVERKYLKSTFMEG